MSENRHGGRIRWGRWVLGSLLVLVLVIVTGHAIWGGIAAGRLQGRIEALRNAGEPILPEDFAVGNVDSPENGGIDVIEAALLLPVVEESDIEREFIPDLPLNEEKRAVLASIVPEHEEALKRLQPAFTKPRLAWEPNLQSPIMGVAMSGREEFGELIRAVNRQAIFDFDRGEHRQALTRLDQLVLLSRYPDTHPSVIGHLIAQGAMSRATGWLIEMSPELNIGDVPRSVPANDVRRMIHLLLEDGPPNRGLVHALRGERMANVDTMNSILAGLAFPVGSDPGRAWPAPLRYLARPVLLTNASTMVDHMTAVIAAADSATLPEAKTRLPPPQKRSFLNQMAYMLMASNDPILESHFRSSTDRRLAAIALAVRWFAVEHQGQLPTTLDELVPAYLPRVPFDPMAIEQKPLRYRLREEEAILWSVGTDGIDEEGNEGPINARHSIGVRWHMKDRVIPLYRRPQPQPLVEPASSTPSPDYDQPGIPDDR